MNKITVSVELLKLLELNCDPFGDPQIVYLRFDCEESAGLQTSLSKIVSQLADLPISFMGRSGFVHFLKSVTVSGIFLASSSSSLGQSHIFATI